MVAVMMVVVSWTSPTAWRCSGEGHGIVVGGTKVLQFPNKPHNHTATITTSTDLQRAERQAWTAVAKAGAVAPTTPEKWEDPETTSKRATPKPATPIAIPKPPNCTARPGSPHPNWQWRRVYRLLSSAWSSTTNNGTSSGRRRKTFSRVTARWTTVRLLVTTLNPP